MTHFHNFVLYNVSIDYLSEHLGEHIDELRRIDKFKETSEFYKQSIESRLVPRPENTSYFNFDFIFNYLKWTLSLVYNVWIITCCIYVTIPIILISVWPVVMQGTWTANVNRVRGV